MTAFKSDFAILDVKDGRDDLRRRVAKGEKVRVQIEAEIDCIWGNDDGTSQEFGLVVRNVAAAST